MKKIFMSKSVIAKIALVLVIILLLEFTMSRPVGAASLGGTLLNPIVNLVVYLADGVLQILQSALTTIDETFSYIDITESKAAFWIKFAMIVGGLLFSVISVFLIIVSGGLAAPALVGLVGSAATGLGVAAGGVYLSVYPEILDNLVGVVFGNSFVYSHIYITPETILKNQIQLFNVNFFNGSENALATDETVTLTDTIRTIVSQVYSTVRDIALVAMLIVIIYIAIRMLLALTPKEKSRYKESMVNCVTGLLLIVVMHFIMSLAVTGLEMITNSIVASNQVVYDLSEDSSPEEVEAYLVSHPDVYNQAISGAALSIESEELYKAVKDEETGESIYEGMVLAGDDKTVKVQMSNFTEQARYMAQKLYVLDEDDNTVETWEHIGWAFVYIMLVVLTVSFVIMYAKRTLFMAALTMFAPIVGIMYPINKANGSRAHTLNLWFREYMSNLIIQPFHLFLYTILIGSVMSMAISNPIYVLIAIMGLLIIENLLKDLLGIQDSRIGGLGKAVQDTTRAIKTTERAATSIARTVGRNVSRSVGTVTGTALSLAAKKKDEGDSNSGEAGANQQPRVQNNPGAQDPNLNPTPPQAQQNPPPQDPDSNVGLPNPEAQDPNLAPGVQDPNLAPGVQNPALNPAARKGLDEVATLQKYSSEGFGTNANGEYFNPYTGEYDSNYTPLNDRGFQVFGGESPALGLDKSTLDMVDDLNGRTPSVASERPDRNNLRSIDGGLGTENSNDRIVLSDGERNIVQNDEGKLRIEMSEGPNTKDPMAMAMAVGSDLGTDTIVGPEPTRVVTIDDRGNNTMSAEELGGGTSNSIASSGGTRSSTHGDIGPSQNIPDGNVIRTSSDNTVQTPSSEDRARFTVLEGGGNNTTEQINNEANVRTETAPQQANTRVVNTGNNTVVNENGETTPQQTNTRVNGNGETAPQQEETNTSQTNNTNNSNTGAQQNRNNTSIGETVLRGVAKGVNVAGRTTEKATGVIGTLVDGVIDVATNAVAGNVSGAAESAVGSVTRAVTGAAPGGPGGGPVMSPRPQPRPVGRPSQNVQHIVRESGMSLDEARNIEAQCKTHRINDSGNMALVAGVYKKASASEQKEIVKLSSMLYEMRRNGRSPQDARKMLEKEGKVSASTRDALMKMYDKLHA